MSERVKPDAWNGAPGASWSGASGSGQGRPVFYRSTILRVIDEEVAKWRHPAALDALRELRARFEEADDE